MKQKITTTKKEIYEKINKYCKYHIDSITYFKNNVLSDFLQVPTF